MTEERGWLIVWIEDMRPTLPLPQEFLLCGTPIFVSGVGALEEVLFVGAGESYRGKSEPEIVSQLKKLVEKSLTETSISRDLRASMAKNLFSLHTMGHKLTQKMLNLSQ